MFENPIVQIALISIGILLLLSVIVYIVVRVVGSNSRSSAGVGNVCEDIIDVISSIVD